MSSMRTDDDPIPVRFPVADFVPAGQPAYAMQGASVVTPATTGWARTRPDGPWHAAVLMPPNEWITACSQQRITARVVVMRGPGRVCGQAACALAQLNDRVRSRPALAAHDEGRAT